MKNKILFLTVAVVLFVGIFTLLVSVVSAKNLHLICSKEPNIKVVLNNEANIDKAKDKILEIPLIKIIKIQNRDEEWSKMVNKMDLPKMDNPFKNEFIIKTNKRANSQEIFNKIKDMSFVEDVQFVSDTECIIKRK